jgi:two-component system chemotaxis response regulator CheY
MSESQNDIVILIIDDSRLMRQLQRGILSTLGPVELVEADSGLAAIQELQARNFQVDLILVDWVMPVMDGITFVQHIKSNPNLRAIPILMVTSCSDEPRMREAWKCGVAGYLLKPFTRELFLQAIVGLDGNEKDEVLEIQEPVEQEGEAPAFLDNVPPELKERLMNLSIPVPYRAGATVCREGELIQHFSCVIHGELEERQSAAGYNATMVRCYRPGECFAVTELMSGDRLASSFVTSEDSTIGKLPREAFEAMLRKYPEMSTAVSKCLTDKARAMDLRDSDNKPKVTGSLEILDLPTLIQGISLRQRTCVIKLPDIQARVCFVNGQIVAAYHQDLVGKEALYKIMEDKPLNFELDLKSVNFERNITESTQRLLLDFARRMDETAVQAPVTAAVPSRG